MIKKMPLSFPSLKNEVVMTYFMLEGTKKMKSMSFHQYSWNSEVKRESAWSVNTIRHVLFIDVRYTIFELLYL